MAKIETMLQAIQTPYSKGVASDDSRLSYRYIYSVMLRMRKFLIAQQIKRRQRISDWNYTVLSCVEMIPVDSHECSCFTGPSCQIYRSRYKIPKMLTNLASHMIEYIMSIDRKMLIDLVDVKSDLYSSGNKYTSKKLKATFENGYLYGLSENFPKLIRMKFLAEDPVEAIKFEQFCGNDEEEDACMSVLDMDFPIDGELEKTVVELSGQEILNIFTQTIEDKSNNSGDSPIEQSK